MAVPIKLVFYDNDSENANAAAKAVFSRFRQLNAILSDYDPQSELNRLAATAGSGQAVRVSDELWTVLAKAQETACLSHGAFDATVSPLVRLWRRARRQKELPAVDKIETAKRLVNYQNIRLVECGRQVELLKPGMRLDLGAIAKGYAADQALAVLARHGITRAMIYAGGDIRVGDPPPGRSGWTVGVGLTTPGGPPRRMLLVARAAVATSGDMWQFVILQGKRYSHIVDPRTGWALTDHSSVTVVAPSGIEADALSTAVAVLGPKEGLALVDASAGAAGMVLVPPGEPDSGRAVGVKEYVSSRWAGLPDAPLPVPAAKPGGAPDRGEL